MQNDQLPNMGVALYCRVSTEEQREGQTIDSQVAELERFAHEKKWAVLDIYKDEGWSGGLLARPALDELRDHARQGRFQTVLVNDVDRLARDVSLLGIIKRDLESSGTRVVFRKLPGEQGPTLNLMVNLLGSFAEFEKELIADRTRRGRRHKVEVRKQHVGALPPYGFKYIPKLSATGETGHLEILPDEAAIVRQIYNWVDQESLSGAKVVARLNEIGIRPKKGGKRWQTSSVRRILRSEVYAGIWYYNKHIHCEPSKPSPHKYRKSLRTSLRLRTRAEWIAVPLSDELKIVDRSVWVRVQQRIDRNTSLSARNTKHFYLLRGMLRCGGCQAAYVGDPRRGTFGYRCVNRCRRYPGIKEDFLNDTVWNAVKSWLEKPEVIKSGINSVVQSNQRQFESGIEHDTRALEQIQAEETRIVQAYRLAVLTADQLRDELKGLQARRTLLNHREPKKAAKVGIEAVCRSLEDYRHQIAERLETLNKEQRREILQHLVVKIIFEGERVKIIGRVAVSSDATRARVSASAETTGLDDMEHANALPDIPPRNIASTTSWDHARNVAGRIAGTTSWNYARNSPHLFQSSETGFIDVTFEFTAAVHRDRTTALAASRANLLRASAARWKRNAA
jgi:site-specific DNA recombinase